MKPLTDQDVKTISYSKAMRYSTHHVYYRRIRTGGQYVEVERLRKWGKDLLVTLTDGKEFVAARNTPFFARKGHRKEAS